MTKADLDYETKSSYMVTVTATDDEDTASIMVTITVTDVDEEIVGLPGDTNSDGMIDKSEVIAAYRAYVADPTDKREIIAIYRQYVQDSASS
jgi:PKD repeat protein